jgi:hypothetical protein
MTAAAGLLAAAFLSGCNLPVGGQNASPTEDAAAAAQTVAAVQTQSGPNIEATGAALQTQPGFTTITPTTTSTALPETKVPEAGCNYRADFIDDVTVPDNAEYDPGDTFIKIWRLRNTSDCRWSPSYLLTFIGGNRLGAPNTVPLSTEVPPGELVDLAVDMQAPQDDGTYQGFWKLRSPDGEFFGIGPKGDQSFWVKIVVPAPPTSEVSLTPTPTVTLTATLTPTGTLQPTETPTYTATPEGSPTNTPTPTATDTPTSTATP